MKDPSTPLFDIVLKALAQTVGREKNDRRIRKQEMKPLSSRMTSLSTQKTPGGLQKERPELTSQHNVHGMQGQHTKPPSCRSNSENQSEMKPNKSCRK